MTSLLPLTLSLGLSLTSPTGNDNIHDLDPNPGAILKVQPGDLPVYGWASWNDGDYRLLGQKMGQYQSLGLGVGLRAKVIDKLSIFLEGGYSFNTGNFREDIQQEVVFTHLVSRHNVISRPIPVNVSGPYDQDSYETTATIDNSPVFRAGVSYDVVKHVRISALYAFQSIPVKYELFDAASRAAGGGWWEENDLVSVDGFMFLLEATF